MEVAQVKPIRFRPISIQPVQMLRADGGGSPPSTPTYRVLGAGANNQGQIGLGASTGDFLTFTQIGSDSDWVKICAGSTHSFAQKADGRLFAFGTNYGFRMGLPNDGQRYDTPTEVTGVPAAMPTQFVAAQTHSLLLANGRIYATGSNSIGQCGFDSGTTVLAGFTQVGVATDWVEISAYGSSSYARKSDGTIWATGFNGNSELGLGDATNRFGFTQIGVDSDWDAIWAGLNCCRARKLDGTVFGWGHNVYGALGLGNDISPVSTPQQASGLVSPQTVIGSNHVGTVLSATGRVLTAGSNQYGTSGKGTTVGETHVYAQVGTDAEHSAAVTGNHDTFVVLNSELWTCGRNQNGQQGHGDTSMRSALAKVLGLSGVAAVDSYNQHTLILADAI